MFARVLLPIHAGYYRGSSQSLWAMVLSWACGWGLFVSVDGGSWRKTVTPVDTKALKDFFLFFFFAEGLCVVWMGQLPP